MRGAQHQATLVYTKRNITDMYAKAVQGMTREDFVPWAEGELNGSTRPEREQAAG
jgi:hypothetical protein